MFSYLSSVFLSGFFADLIGGFVDLLRFLF
jgi:hypothetical protein